MLLSRHAEKGTHCGQDGFVEAVGHLARGIAYMDCCSECDRFTDTNDPDTFINTSAAPCITIIEDGWLQGVYVCAEGHQWNCGYSLLIHDLVP